MKRMVGRGQVTRWTTRNSPGDPPPLGSGREAWVRPNSNDIWCGAHDRLRAMRLDTSAFTRETQVRFAYRCRAGFALWATADEGLHWRRLDTIPETSAWTWFNRLYSLAPGAWYLRLDYDGETHSADNSGLSANIDDAAASARSPAHRRRSTSLRITPAIRFPATRCSRPTRRTIPAWPRCGGTLTTAWRRRTAMARHGSTAAIRRAMTTCRWCG